MSRSHLAEPHRSNRSLPFLLAWALVCALFLLIGLGQLVTLYQAGRAQPEWSLAFPWFLHIEAATISWGRLLEHSHRLFAALVTLLAMAFAFVLWRDKSLSRLRWLGVAVIGGMLLEGLFAWMGATTGNRHWAELHNCLAPLLFVLATTFIPLCCHEPIEAYKSTNAQVLRRLHIGSVLVAMGIYLQMVLGAFLHPPFLTEATLGQFTLWVWLHTSVSLLLMILVLPLPWFLAKRLPNETKLLRRIKLLVAMMAGELLLGIAAWVTHYGWPAWFTDWILMVDYTVVAEGWLQILSAVAHQLVGLLLLATAWNFVLSGRTPTQGV